jgi:hypothetical protein
MHENKLNNLIATMRSHIRVCGDPMADALVEAFDNIVGALREEHDITRKHQEIAESIAKSRLDAIFELRAINEQRNQQIVNQAEMIRNMRASIDRLTAGDKPDIINLCGADVAAGLKFMDAAYAPQSRHAAHDEVLSESVKQEGCALDPLEDAIGAVTQALVDTLGVPAELVRIQIINGNQARGLDGTYDDGARGYGYGPVAGSLGPFNRRG